MHKLELVQGYFSIITIELDATITGNFYVDVDLWKARSWPWISSSSVKWFVLLNTQAFRSEHLDCSVIPLMIDSCIMLVHLIKYVACNTVPSIEYNKINPCALGHSQSEQVRM